MLSSSGTLRIGKTGTSWNSRRQAFNRELILPVPTPPVRNCSRPLIKWSSSVTQSEIDEPCGAIPFKVGRSPGTAADALVGLLGLDGVEFNWRPAGPGGP